MTKKEKLKAIFEIHGLSKQLKKLSEEVFELQEALMDYEYAKIFKENSVEKSFKEHIEEEFADAMVLLTEISTYYNLDKENIEKWYDYKINRQCKRDGINDMSK